MPAGPAYPVVYPASRPRLPAAPGAVLDKLNTYRTGCADRPGYCDAVGVLANMFIGYGNVDITPFVIISRLPTCPG